MTNITWICCNFLLASAILLVNIATADNNDGKVENDNEKYSSMEGHMKPLGSVGPYFDLFEIEGFPSSPREFFNKYVIPSTPVLMRNAAKISPAFTKWTDTYFLNHPGSEVVKIFAEGRKKEIRTEPGSMMTFKEFVENYNTTDMYMVHVLPKHIQGDVLIPPPLQCDPVIEKLLDVVTWFSSGGTKSVLHNDDVDNINCLYRGNKTLVFLNPHDSNEIWSKLIDRPDGSYSSMDVDAVDYTKFPDLANVRYSRIDMKAGDCLYIPYRWYHQVNSFGSNLAVNLWWTHQTVEFFDLNDEKCGDFTGRNTIANVTVPGMNQDDEESPEAQSDDPPTKEFLERFSDENSNKTPPTNTEENTPSTEDEAKPTPETPAKNVDDIKTEESKEEKDGNDKLSSVEISLTDKIFTAIMRIKKPVQLSGLKRYVLKKYKENEQHWDDRCQEILINYFGMLDQNKDTVITVEDADLYYKADEHTRSQNQDVTSFFEDDLQQAFDNAIAQKERVLVKKLLDRGELDKEQISIIFGKNFEILTSSHGKDEL